LEAIVDDRETLPGGFVQQRVVSRGKGSCKCKGGC
jgi:hypothetical protein